MHVQETAINAFHKAAAELREKGFAITIFYPYELEENNITPKAAEDAMVQAVNDLAD